MVGSGIYSVPEAGQLTGIPARDLRRWLFGYTVTTRERGRIAYPGVWTPRYAGENELALSFADLLEVRFVSAFRRYGVSLQTIRAASEVAREVLEKSYPFTSYRFRTDGKAVFAEIAKEVGEAEIMDLARKQYVFRQVIAPSLYSGIEYDNAGDARRWYPLGSNNRAIVLDPERRFGKPILANSGLETETVAHYVETEGSVARVAKLFELEAGDVQRAIRFERRIAQRASIH